MNTHFKITGLHLALSFLLLGMDGYFALAQSRSFTFNSGEIEVSGFTNNHKWKMKTDSVDCQAAITLTDGRLRAINSLIFTVPVKELSSPNPVMDRIAYRTLRSYPFDKIYFRYVRAEITDWDDKDQYQLAAQGNLQIAGITQAISMNLIATVIHDGTIMFSGTHNLKLSDFKVTPKKALMGSMKTRDEIQVNFIINLKPGR